MTEDIPHADAESIEGREAPDACQRAKPGRDSKTPSYQLYSFRQQSCILPAIPILCHRGNPMRHPKAEAWELKLKIIFDQIDAELEEKYGHLYPLHPARPKHGTTANPEHSGLFNVRASFSGGFGSWLGAGYVVDVDLLTLSTVPARIEEQIEEEVVARLREELPQVFPGRNLEVTHDGRRFKIHGDLSLGTA